jgi:CheY-like chemotaxis protein
MPHRPGVLVVDDNAGNLAALEQTFGELGYRTDHAMSGLGALSRLRTQPPPRLIVLDIYMPGMDGLTFLRECRRNPTWAGIPVLVLTAASADSIADLEGEILGGLGPAVVVQKPAEKEKLLAVLPALLGEGKS